MSAQPRRFDGRVAIVTGASGGIGRSIAERLVAEGATVAGCDLEAPAWLAEAGHVARSCDVTREQSVDALVAEVAERFGRVDVLVNNAGLSISAPIAETSLAAWNQILAVNLTGVFLFCRAALPHMQAGADGEKAIVSVASVAGRRPEALIGPYCAAKAGVINFTRVLALEAAPRVRANCVCPGAVDTAMLRASTQVAAEAAGRSLEDALRERAAATPLRRLQSADSIASAVLFLASDDARDVTGQAIEVDGGEFMP